MNAERQAHARDSRERLQELNGALAHQVEERTAERDLLAAEQGRDRERLIAAQEALRQSQKMEAIGQLTGGVAHDFNNLLAIIKTSTDLLQRPDIGEDRRRRYVDAISATVDRATRLTGQLLAFVRRQPPKTELFDVGGRVVAITDMLHAIGGGGVSIETRLPREPCFVDADASQFETALVNLAVNARDAMSGEGRLTVRVELAPRADAAADDPAGSSGAFVAISIIDTGAGIPDDVRTRIFEPFFTTKDVGKGTGLGLSQVIGFARQAGGDIVVESAVGQGTAFILYLPEARRAEVGTSSPETVLLPFPLSRQ